MHKNYKYNFIHGERDNRGRKALEFTTTSLTLTSSEEVILEIRKKYKKSLSRLVDKLLIFYMNLNEKKQKKINKIDIAKALINQNISNIVKNEEEKTIN